MKKFVVQTAYGDHETWAVSKEKAINNVKWRLRQTGVSHFNLHVEYWTVIEK